MQGMTVALLVGFLVPGQDLSPIREGKGQKGVQALEAAFSRMTSTKGIVNAVALVEAPRDRVLWRKAYGIANPQTAQKMTPEHLFRTASVTKIFTAVVVLQLIEEGKFTLDTPLSELLLPGDLPNNRTVDDLLVWEGKTRGKDIRIRHLLGHTSGLPDYWGEKILAGPDRGKTCIDCLFAAMKNPEANDFYRRQWMPKMVMEYYFDCGFPQAAKGQPGQNFSYADTNFSSSKNDPKGKCPKPGVGPWPHQRRSSVPAGRPHQ